MDQPGFMEVFPFETLGAIVVFWIVVIAILVLIIRRLNYMKKLRVTHNNTPPRDPKRIIQIYYIENIDDSQVSGPALSILNKFLSTSEPPTYAEATSSREANDVSNNDQPTTSESVLTENSLESNTNLPVRNPEENRDLVIVVERSLP